MEYSRIDSNLGLTKEIELVKIIKNKINDDELDHTKSKYSFIDYHSNKNIVELKTRRCFKNKYYDTMISKSKIDKMIIDGRNAYLFFSFLDGLFYIEINKEIIKKFRLSRGGRCDRGFKESNIYYYIPINILEEVK